MASGVDGFGPKVVCGLELGHHRSCHLNKCAVLPFGYTILLESISSGILMTNPFFTKELVQGVVLELGTIVTSYHQDWDIVLTLSFIGEVDDSLLSLHLRLEEENPCVS